MRTEIFYNDRDSVIYLDCCPELFLETDKLESSCVLTEEGGTEHDNIPLINIYKIVFYPND